MDEYEPVYEEPAYEQAWRPEPELPPARPRFSRIGWAFMLMIIVQQGGGALVILAAHALRPALTANSWFLICATFLPLYLLGLPLFLAVIRKLPDLRAGTKARILPGEFVMLFFASMAASYVLNLLSLWLTSLIGGLKGGEVTNLLGDMVENSDPWALLLFAVVLAPVFEELVFRWLLYKKLSAYGAKTYVLFSALVFALYHGNLNQMFYAFVLGLALGWLTYCTGNIRASVTLHLLVNLTGSCMPLLLRLPFFNREDQLPLLAYGGMLLAMCITGLLSAVVLYSRRRAFAMPAGLYPPPPGKAVFGNAGMVVLLAAMTALTAYMVMV